MKEKIWELYEEIKISIIRISTISARKRDLILQRLSELVEMMLVNEDKK